jgi:Bacterial regulatory proteins, gntR family
VIRLVCTRGDDSDVATVEGCIVASRRRTPRPRGISGASIISTMDGLQVDPGSPTLLHEQVAADIRRVIADGEAGPGERLPPARDLAKVLGVNANTVLRALGNCETRDWSSSGEAMGSRSPGKRRRGVPSSPGRGISSISHVCRAISPMN